MRNAAITWISWNKNNWKEVFLQLLVRHDKQISPVLLVFKRKKCILSEGVKLETSIGLLLVDLVDLLNGVHPGVPISFGLTEGGRIIDIATCNKSINSRQELDHIPQNKLPTPTPKQI